ncbi:MAG: Flp pilus assembly complex ATPase component TadA [Acidimicrobiia bacterium]|nr:Flp pilus assembly complex ATPase component TadA [Acidimicrobiia bacterium]NNL27922.1 CpaF family protein [Acidimicrobiia bacterium]
MTRLGFLQPLIDDASVEEIIVLGGQRTFVVRDGRKHLITEVADIETVRRIAEQLLAGTGRRLDLANPIVSAQLTDGSRVHITGPPVTHEDRLNIQIRKFVLAADRLSSLVDRGSLTPLAADLLGAAVRADKTILVAGAPGAGKTTLVNCLLNEVPADRRVVTAEEVFEIQANLPDMTQMQTREVGLDGGGVITLRDLVREALRQRPDRIVIGEVRGPEALDMLMALNAGCSGLATVHANSSRDALEKLVSYSVLAGENISIPFVRSTASSVIDLVVHLKRSDHGRRVDEIVSVNPQMDDRLFTVQTLFEHSQGALRWTGMRPTDGDDYRAVGMRWPQ